MARRIKNPDRENIRLGLNSRKQKLRLPLQPEGSAGYNARY
jgi:hypothetical protein